MPRRKKGPRLYLREGRIDARSGRALPARYYIRDGQKEFGTGCGPESLAAAEKALADYIADKWRPDAGEQGPRSGHPASVYVAEVIALYLQDKADAAPDPSAVRARFKPLLSFFGEDTLADVKRSRCREYVEWRTAQPIASAKDPDSARRVSVQGARRELEDLSAAIGHWSGEYPLTFRPKVWLPPKPESHRDALTRGQAARLLKAALGYRIQPDGTWKRLQGSSVANRAHLRRFILIALYTGTRPGVIPKLLWHESPAQAWADLNARTIYRRGRDERDHRTKRRPLVRIPSRLLAHMKRWKAADERATAEAQARGEDRTLSTIIHHGGRPLAGRIRRGFEACVRDAGLAAGITPHWQRHTSATWLMEGGADLWDAAGYTGMTVQTLERCYGHHRPDHQSGAHRALKR